MNIKKLTIMVLIGISALSFCHSAFSYTKAMVTSPAILKITSSNKALIGILGVEIDDEAGCPYVLVKNNMARRITIKKLTIEFSNETRDQEADIPISPGATERIYLDQLAQGRSGEERVTLTISAKWFGGEAEIKHTFDLNLDEEQSKPEPEESEPERKDEEIPEEEQKPQNDPVQEDELIDGEDSEGGEGLDEPVDYENKDNQGVDEDQ